MNQRNTPFLRLTVPFALGTALGGWLDQAPTCLYGLFGANLFFSLFLAIRRYKYRNRWFFGATVNACLLLAGYILIVQHNELRQPKHFAAQQGHGNYMVCTVYEAPSHGGKTKIPVLVEAMGNSPDSLVSVAGNLLLFLDPSPLVDSIRYGDRLGIHAMAMPTEPPKNPHVFDYKRYLHFQNIHYQSFVKPDSVLLLSSGHGFKLWARAYKCRDQLLAILQKHFPTQNEYAVASALMVGYKDDLSDELRTAYAETGSMHALAVSGTHVGMVYMGLYFITKRLRLRGKWRVLETIFILLAIWSFTFLTGATASVMRASVMFSTYMLGKAIWRNASAWNVLPASAFGLLLFNPYFLFDVGFQLSYTAVAGMVFFYPRLYKLFPPGPRWADECLKVLLVGAAAQLGTLPFALYYFNQFPIYFWLAGWIVVLGAAAVLWGGSMLVLLDTFPRLSLFDTDIFQTLADWLGNALYFMVLYLNKAIVGIQSLPGSVISDVWIPAWVDAALYICIAFLGTLIVLRRGRWLAAFFGLMGLLGVYRISTMSAKQIQRKMVVYSLSKQQRLVDFFDGRHAFALADTLTPKQENFTAKPNRVASGIREKTTIMLDEKQPFRSDNLLYDKPFVQFFQQKMAFIDDNRWITADASPIEIDVLVLSKSPELSIAACQEKFPFGVIVFDASNSRRKVARWQQECAENGWVCHDVRTQGAWISRQE